MICGLQSLEVLIENIIVFQPTVVRVYYILKRHFSIESLISYFKPSDSQYSLFSLDAEILALFTTAKREVSYANNLTPAIIPKRRSLM